MSNLVQCPHCGANIENDSWYCDQCSNELMRCPKCGNYCRGKFCARCGVATVKASEAAQPQPVQPQPQPVQPQPQPVQPQPVQPQSACQQPYRSARPTTDPQQSVGTGTGIPGAAPVGPQALVCRAMGVRLPLIPGAIIGRINGQYADRLCTFQYVSGTHARIDCTGGAWTITDLGSRNGTAVNGMRCAPALPFRTGDIIRLSNFYDFSVE